MHARHMIDNVVDTRKLLLLRRGTIGFQQTNEVLRFVQNVTQGFAVLQITDLVVRQDLILTGVAHTCSAPKWRLGKPLDVDLIITAFGKRQIQIVLRQRVEHGFRHSLLLLYDCFIAFSASTQQAQCLWPAIRRRPFEFHPAHVRA